MKTELIVDIEMIFDYSSVPCDWIMVFWNILFYWYKPMDYSLHVSVSNIDFDSHL